MFSMSLQLPHTITHTTDSTTPTALMLVAVMHIAQELALVGLHSHLNAVMDLHGQMNVAPVLVDRWDVVWVGASALGLRMFSFGLAPLFR